MREALSIRKFRDKIASDHRIENQLNDFEVMVLNGSINVAINQLET